jgi:hypothetical protein
MLLPLRDCSNWSPELMRAEVLQPHEILKIEVNSSRPGLRVVRVLEGRTRRANVVTLPDSMHRGPGNPHVLGERTNAPVGTSLAGPGLPCGVEDPLLQLWRQDLGPAFPFANSRNRPHPVPGECGAQGQNSRPRYVQLLCDGSIGNTLMSEKENTTAQRHFLGAIAVAGQRFKLALLVVIHGQRGC